MVLIIMFPSLNSKLPSNIISSRSSITYNDSKYSIIQIILELLRLARVGNNRKRQFCFNTGYFYKTMYPIILLGQILIWTNKYRHQNRRNKISAKMRDCHHWIERIQNSIDKIQDFITWRRPPSQDFSICLHFKNSIKYG